MVSKKKVLRKKTPVGGEIDFEGWGYFLREKDVLFRLRKHSLIGLIDQQRGKDTLAKC